MVSPGWAVTGWPSSSKATAGCGAAVDGRTGPPLRQVVQQVGVPLPGLHQRSRLGRAHAAGRALAAAFVFKKPHHVQHRIARAVVLAEHDDGGRADKAAVGLQRVEVQGNLVQAGRQDAARGAAWQVRIELVAVQHAAAVFVDEFLHRDARWSKLDARVLHPPAYAERPQTLTPVATKAGKPR